MFTGIVTELGTVRERADTPTGARLTIGAASTLVGLAEGDSVAVNGACMTATSISSDRFTVDVIHESLARTTLGDLAPGDAVDLERPLAANGRLDGHFVQGHVDGVGVVSECVRGAEVRLRIDVPDDLGPYLVEKGSVAVDGVSLTVTAVAPSGTTPQWFEVALIPHTLDETVVGRRDVGSRVNIEVDVLAKYVERMMGARA